MNPEPSTLNREPFFRTIERVLALQFHAAELVDTPFAPHAMVPGAGVDCVHVNAWCYLKTGFLTEFNPPKYALDSGAHSKDSALLAWFKDREDFIEVGRVTPCAPPAAGSGVPALPVQAGDTICFNLGLSEHHVGLMIGPRNFVHVLPRRRVIISSLDESCYAHRVTAVFRPLETPHSELRNPHSTYVR